MSRLLRLPAKLKGEGVPDNKVNGMNTKGLQIGNLFQTQKGDLLSVLELKESGVVFQVVDRKKFPLDYQWQAGPILLTEEWLLRLGFKKEAFNHPDNSIEDLFEKHPLRVSESFITNGSFIVAFKVPSQHWKHNYIGSLRYVHELQNLYHALTGEELILTATVC